MPAFSRLSSAVRDVGAMCKGGRGWVVPQGHFGGRQLQQSKGGCASWAFGMILSAFAMNG
eukprot:185922-Lingulodinium_polyedra.AAC.1